MAQTPRWYFLLRLCECVCVFLNPNPLNTPPTPPPAPKALYSFPFRSGRSRGASSRLRPYGFSCCCARKVGFPDPSGYFKGLRGELPLPFGRWRRGWFIVLILTSWLPRRNERQGRMQRRSPGLRSPIDLIPASACFYYGPLQLFSALCNKLSVLTFVSFFPSRSDLAL